VIPDGMLVPVAVRLVANCYTTFSLFHSVFNGQVVTFTSLRTRWAFIVCRLWSFSCPVIKGSLLVSGRLIYSMHSLYCRPL